MPRKPNYRFERSDRERTKAARKAERLKAKAEKSELRKTAKDESAQPEDEDVTGGSRADGPETSGG